MPKKTRYPAPMDYQPAGGGMYQERCLYQSPAYASLKRASVQVLNAILDSRIIKRVKVRERKGGKKVDKWVVENAEALTAPYVRLEEKFYMYPAAVARGIDDLLEKGFVRITYQGGRCRQDMSTYKLVDDYLRWRPGVVFHERPKGEQRGWQKNKRSQNDSLTHSQIVSDNEKTDEPEKQVRRRRKVSEKQTKGCTV